MGKLATLATNLSQFNLNEELDRILIDLKDVITGMNKEQLSIGKDANGQTLEAYESPEYAVLKVEHFDSQAPLGIPNLKLSGDFYEGFTIKTTKDSVLLSSTDWKNAILKSHYGEDIFGLQSDKLSELAHRYILPRLVNRIKNLI